MRLCLAATFAALALSACARGHVRTSPSAEYGDVAGDVDVLAQPGARAPLASSNYRSEFEERLRHSAAGQFITGDVLAANGDELLIQVLTTHIRGFTTTGDSHGAPGFASSCSVSVFVNGLPTGDVLTLLQPRDLVGVEYYEATSAPVKYRRAFSSCPVLLLWLRP